MPLTTSLDIVDIVSENALMCTLGTSPQTYPSFMSAEQWERNEDDDTVCPFIYLQRPLNYSIKTIHDKRIENHKVKIFFCGSQLELESPIVDSGPVMLSMRALADQFIYRLAIDDRITLEGDWQTDEVLGLDDRNAYGVVIEGNVSIVKSTGYSCS